MQMAHKTRKRLRITRRFYAVVLGCLGVVMGLTFWRQQTELNRLMQAHQQLEQTQTEQSLAKDKLTQQLETANTPEYIESIAREKLGWVKQGETRYVESK